MLSAVMNACASHVHGQQTSVHSVGRKGESSACITLEQQDRVAQLVLLKVWAVQCWPVDLEQ